jgi:trimeric autotransporter adhesin
MKRFRRSSCVFLAMLLLGSWLSAQQASSNPTSPAVVPRLVNYTGKAVDAQGKVISGIAGATFGIYREQTGGSPLWLETQNIQADTRGNYIVQLGTTKPEGLPLDVFTSGEARWLGVRINGGEEQARVLLLSVPYALKAADAETVGGLPASAFMLAPAAMAGSASSTGAVSEATSGTVPPPATITGSGAPGFLPDFTGAATIGNSAVFQSGASPTAKIGINTNAPSVTLDVHGGAAIRGTLLLPSVGTATAGSGKTSQVENLVASVFNSGTSTAVNETFQLKAEPVNNNTASATGRLSLLFGQGTATPVETGFSIANNGRLTFAPGQTFPGTGPGTVTKVSTGLGLTGGPITSSGTIAIDTSVVPQRGVNNLWPADQSFLGSIGVSNNGTISGSLGVGGNIGVGGTISANAETFGGSIQFTDNGVSGALQPPLMINAVDCCSFGDRMIWAHSPGFNQWGIYYNDDFDEVIIQPDLADPVATFDFSGDLTLAGTLTAPSKNFKIDHPLDPTNKFLYHASVESSEMMDIYTGNTVLNDAGEAVVSLPEWFEAVNTDFRYNLTAIGAAAPNLHIAQEVANHRFSIAGGAPGTKVSWQVTGVRHDPYAKAHPMSAEVNKTGKELGHYQNPEAYGMPRATVQRMQQMKAASRKLAASKGTMGNR